MEKKTYVAAEGIEAVNGKAVPTNREVVLTEREALYDLSLGRITAKEVPPRATGRKKNGPPETAVEAEPGLGETAGED
jgi:hypothetical protein